ncbi:NAD(P)-dependent oxidoreductase [Nocardioides agariphilus]|uniref:NAD(P)-dependent oxidoreductase n=2 Tax=Nocardioides agariphilus TaxID=433664 RepID=A0A930YRD1_9ACTN|nr:NAD(P)-dependent oxidoreductase [Nocardioides agariphilus]MBF4770520.1 NAD(P)-dependent oxidoreductase [Nocardioides agariphilus]
MVGLGNMGGRMTRRLVAAGHRVLGYDVDPARAAEIGCEPAASVADLAAEATVVLLSLPDSGVVERVVLGDGGLLQSCHEGQVVVDLGTSSPASTVRLHARFGERGVELLDAGISGGAVAAEAGSLTLMVGGSAQTLEDLAWVTDPIAASVVHMGAPGNGHLTKVLNNFLNAVSLAATSEVMVAARKAGLDLARVLDVLNSSSGVNFATQKRFPAIITGDYLEGGLTNALMTKDVALYVAALADLGVTSLNAAGPLASFGLANNLGYADQISNRVVDALGDAAGGVRLHSSDEHSEEDA